MCYTKTPGKWHHFGDHCAVNVATEPNRYPIPFLQVCSASLWGKTILFKFDLVLTYHQIPVHAADISKPTVILLFRLLKFMCMPFRLRKALQMFQRFMNGIPRIWTLLALSWTTSLLKNRTLVKRDQFHAAI